MKNRFLFIFSLVWFVLIGCKDTPEIPKGTAETAKMVAILTDIHLMEAKMSQMGNISLDSITIISEHLKNQILKKHNIDSATYYQSYYFYATTPELMEGIYDKVLANLKAKKEKKDYKGL